MKTAALCVVETIDPSLPGAGNRSDFSRLVHEWLEQRAKARRARKARRQRIRERVQTQKIMADLPFDIRADVGWPDRYDLQGQDD
ncbi:MAG TPA: hypothetical protein VFJ18_12925 [Pararhizobium sp.]|nr:hypothetical protein [Pararhizobium sp.]